MRVRSTLDSTSTSRRLIFNSSARPSAVEFSNGLMKAMFFILKMIMLCLLFFFFFYIDSLCSKYYFDYHISWNINHVFLIIWNMLRLIFQSNLYNAIKVKQNKDNTFGFQLNDSGVWAQVYLYSAFPHILVLLVCL